MSPISKTMEKRYTTALRTVSLFLADEFPSNAVTLEAISELKGMFNRCLRKDQWDWFTVYERLGHPPRKQMQYFVFKLVELRKSLKDQDVERANSIKNELVSANFKHFLTQWHQELYSKGAKH